MGRRRTSEILLLPTSDKLLRPVTLEEELALWRSGTLRFKDTARLPCSAIDHDTPAELLQELAEGLTRIEGEAQHLRATVERLRKTTMEA